MAGVISCKLSDLTPNSKNIIIRAVIISKTKPHYFMAKDANAFRGVITFTLRDSRISVCNCKFWGSKEKVAEYNCKMKIGDVISIVNPTVVLAGIEAFVPKATMPIMLVVNEDIGSLTNVGFRNFDESNMLQELLHISHKQLCYTLRLADVKQGAKTSPGAALAATVNKTTVDLLVMVGGIRPVREIRGSENAKCMEVIVFDSSIPEGMILSIWHADWIERAQQCWQAMKTILHLIDVVVVESNYHRTSILRFTLQSLVYENPVGAETDALRMYASRLEARNFDSLLQMNNAEKLPNPEDINTQMSVKQIYMRLEGHLKDDSAEFSAVLYAMITKFDIDGGNYVLSRKCKYCQCLLSTYATTCDSEKCQLEFSLNSSGDNIEYFYNINIHFGDHTGTLTETRLSGSAAERLLEIAVSDFRELLARNDERIEKLKWKFLMNFFKVKLLIRKPNAVRRKAAIIIVDMKRVESLEIANSIVVF